MRTTREMIREFNVAFGRPVNTEVVSLSVRDRELLGKLIFEECVEYITLGLGLVIADNIGNALAGRADEGGGYNLMKLNLDEGQRYDPIESADGLGDMNVVIHFNAHWHGFNLDAVTEEIHDSNMSKLDDDGNPIINECCYGDEDSEHDCGLEPELCVAQDESKPIGKILKSSNFFKPSLQSILDEGNH